MGRRPSQSISVTMVKVIKQYGGTIDEFIGDAIFVLFGAPSGKRTMRSARSPAR